MTPRTKRVVGLQRRVKVCVLLATINSLAIFELVDRWRSIRPAARNKTAWNRDGNALQVMNRTVRQR
jgi:hypothetical protein